MATPTIPPPPSGTIVDAPGGNIPPPPSGTIVDASQHQQQPQPPKTGMQRANDALTGANEKDPMWQSPYVGGLLSGGLKSATNMVGNVLDMITQKPRP